MSSFRQLHFYVNGMFVELEMQRNSSKDGMHGEFWETKREGFKRISFEKRKAREDSHTKNKATTEMDTWIYVKNKKKEKPQLEPVLKMIAL